MSLHRISRVTIGVPDVEVVAAYYEEFGLTRLPGGVGEPVGLSTSDGGEQLRVVPSARRRLAELCLDVEDLDDLDRISASLARLGIEATRDSSSLSATEPGTAVRVTVMVSEQRAQPAVVPPAVNAPGAVGRPNRRADGVMRSSAVKPRKLGHVVLGSTDEQRSERFFVEGLGLKVSDRVAGLAAFLRCSTDHHNLLVQQAPVPLLHHTAWQVDDIDEVGRGATAMLAADPDRHVWGLGRHHIGSNFFWYLRDPAGNFSEYYSDLDSIVDDSLWTPGTWEGARGLYNWGPPPPPSFLAPEDLGELMAQSH